MDIELFDHKQKELTEVINKLETLAANSKYSHVDKGQFEALCRKAQALYDWLVVFSLRQGGGRTNELHINTGS